MLPAPSCMWVAATLFVRSIIPPTDRSIPRVRTTMLCPTAAKTSGIDVFTSDVHSNEPGRRESSR